ncbi:MAG: ABC transporter ATP-binding protein [Patescibacteria group bacterium]|jgi:ATP-binding cassette subfamily B protein
MISLLKSYKALVTLVIALALGQQMLNLIVPKIISKAINTFALGVFSMPTILTEFAVVAGGIFILGALLAVFQTYVSEKVARDLRNQLASKVSRQDFLYVQRKTPGILLTNFSSDIDAVKQFVSQAVPTVLSSLFVIIGAAYFLLSINWQLGLAVLSIVPLIGTALFGLFGFIRPLFKKGQEVIDKLNSVINESILGAAIIRVLNSQVIEYNRFIKTNTEAKDVGMQILKMFAGLIPLITLIANGAMLVMVLLGGRFIINGTLTIGDFAAFMTYLGILIFPIFMLGFMSNAISRAGVSYARIEEVLKAPEEKEGGDDVVNFKGELSVTDVSLAYETKTILKNATFHVHPNTKTAIIGPTAAGKTQLLYLLSGLTKPDAGTIAYDSKPMFDYDQKQLRQHLGIVFQDSVLFNLTLRENIAFGQNVGERDLQLAIETAELGDFVNSLEHGLDTLVSERGTNLSGGQKQRIMLARALAHAPNILFLDDFTARVDANTERKVLANIENNYPHLTLVSVTQKVTNTEAYDQIILLMEGEILAVGTHTELMKTSPEYVQIVDSQRSTNAYELQS